MATRNEILMMNMGDEEKTGWLVLPITRQKIKMNLVCLAAGASNVRILIRSSGVPRDYDFQ